MTFFGLDVFHAAVAVALGLCAIALFAGFARLAIGPSLADRVVALDLITNVLVVVLTLFSLSVDNGAYLDAAIALALVAFLATVAFARYIDRTPRTAPPAGETEGGDAP